MKHLYPSYWQFKALAVTGMVKIMSRFRNFCVLLVFIFISFSSVYSQNAIVGSGFASGWGGVTCPTGNSNFSYLSSGAGSSYKFTAVANGTGFQYFRMGVDFGGTTGQYNQTGGAPDAIVTPNTPYHLNGTCTTTGAMYLNVASTTHNYIFKTKDASATPSFDFIIFNVQGAVRTASNVSQNPIIVNSCQSVAITATLDGALSTGQGVYLRYSNDNFATSTVVAMTGSGTSYTASIPSGINTASANVKYYVFTSGDGLTISGANADWYTINLNNNAGANYSYTVADTWITAQNGNWSVPATWLCGSVPPSGASVIIDHNVTLNQDATVSSITINAGKTFTASDASARILTISNNSSVTTLANNGIWASGAGGSTVVFTSGSDMTHFVTGTLGFNNVRIECATGTNNVGVNFGPTSVVNGILQLRARGYVNTNAPTYAVGSTLQYFIGGVYNRRVEWSQPSGNAYPYNVQISNNTILDPGGASFTGTVFNMAGSLTIDAGSSLYMDYLGNNMTVPLNIGGNL